jgi:hypothetical protein
VTATTDVRTSHTLAYTRVPHSIKSPGIIAVYYECMIYYTAKKSPSITCPGVITRVSSERERERMAGKGTGLPWIGNKLEREGPQGRPGGPGQARQK